MIAEIYFKRNDECLHIICECENTGKVTKVFKKLKYDNDLWDTLYSLNSDEHQNLIIHPDWIVHDDKFGTKEKYPEYFI